MFKLLKDELVFYIYIFIILRIKPLLLNESTCPLHKFFYFLPECEAVNRLFCLNYLLINDRHVAIYIPLFIIVSLVYF